MIGAPKTQITHVRQTASSHSKQVKRISRFPEKDHNMYFTVAEPGLCPGQKLLLHKQATLKENNSNSLLSV